jgi:alpha-L-fucosidase
MGVYYSFLEWYNPLWLADRPRFVRDHMQPQLKDLVTRYRPDVLWTDGEWNGPDTLWKSSDLPRGRVDPFTGGTSIARW